LLSSHFIVCFHGVVLEKDGEDQVDR